MPSRSPLPQDGVSIEGPSGPSEKLRRQCCRRVLPALFAVLAAIADSRGAHGLAFDALLGAVPFTGVAALEAFGAYLDDRGGRLGGLQALLWLLALTLLVLSCAVALSRDAPAVGPAARRVGARRVLGVYALKVLLALAPYARLALRPAKP